MVKLYFAPNTRSVRVLWLLEELEVPHELVRVVFQRTTDTVFVQATPTGKFPTIDDDGIVMFESGAIVEYILERFGNGRLEPPRGSPARAAYLQWLHFAEGTAFGPIGQIVWLGLYRDDADSSAAILALHRKSAAQVFDIIEAAVTGRDYLVDDMLTAADIMMGFTLWAARSLGVLGDAHPETLRYLRTLRQRPAFAHALSIGRD